MLAQSGTLGRGGCLGWRTSLLQARVGRGGEEDWRCAVPSDVAVPWSHFPTAGGSWLQPHTHLGTGCCSKMMAKRPGAQLQWG